MLRLSRNTETCEKTVAKHLVKGKTDLESSDSLRQAYSILEEIFQRGALLNYINTKASDKTQIGHSGLPTNQPTSRLGDDKTAIGKIIRHYHDPEIQLVVHKAKTLRPGSLAWVLTSSLPKETKGQKKGGRAISFCSNLLTLLSSRGLPTILKDQKVINSYHGLSYFNTLASLWKRAHENHETSNVIIHENDSAVMALRNTLNGNHDIINLRKLLVKRGIRLFFANKEDWTRLVSQVSELLNRQDCPKTVLLVKWPQVELRKLRNGELSILEKYKARQIDELPTKTIRHICPLAGKWTKIPLDHLSNQTIMMLTGMVSNQHNLLVRGELDAQTTNYPGCRLWRRAVATGRTLAYIRGAMPVEK